MDAWWPGLEPSESIDFDPRVGGGVYRVGPSGRSLLGVVTEIDPPHRLMLDWRPDSPDGQAVRLEVTFRATGDVTEVDLVIRLDDARKSSGQSHGYGIKLRETLKALGSF